MNGTGLKSPRMLISRPSPALRTFSTSAARASLSAMTICSRCPSAASFCFSRSMLAAETVRRLAVELDRQHRRRIALDEGQVARVVGVRARHVEQHLVQQLDRRRPDFQQPRHRFQRGVQLAIVHQRQAGHARARNQRQIDFGYGAKRAFRPDE